MKARRAHAADTSKSHNGAKSKKAAAARAARIAASAKLTEAVSDAPPPTSIKPSFWAYLRACVRLIDAGKPCSQINLAKELHITPQSVWKFLRRNTGVMAFAEREMREQNAHFLAPIVRRHSMIAMQGSVQSADFVAKVHGGYYLRAASAGSDGELGATAPVVQMNFLIPRPDYPQLAPAPVPVVPAVTDIPTLAIR